MSRRSWLLILLIVVILMVGCGGLQNGDKSSSQPLLSDSVRIEKRPTQPAQVVVPRQNAATPDVTGTAAPARTASSPTTKETPVPAFSTPTNIPDSGTGSSPYGQPPALTSAEDQLTQQLFALINSDRAAHGLYLFTWNATLSGGARLHSWNMYHCGFSHTCPDGRDQCVRIASEGFTGYSDCGENIGYAGPFPTAWSGVHNIQEGMAHEGPTGWHYIHLFSTTLHRVGVGLYVDPNGYTWFTEDMVS